MLTDLFAQRLDVVLGELLALEELLDPSVQLLQRALLAHLHLLGRRGQSGSLRRVSRGSIKGRRRRFEIKSLFAAAAE